MSATGPIFAFDLGGREKAFALLDALQLVDGINIDDVNHGPDPSGAQTLTQVLGGIAVTSLHLGHLTDLLAAWEGEAPKGDALARLEAFTRFHIRFHLPRADQVFVAYMELRNLEPVNFRKVEGLRRRYEDKLEEILRAGEGEGVFALADTRITTDKHQCPRDEPAAQHPVEFTDSGLQAVLGFQLDGINRNRD